MHQPRQINSFLHWLNKTRSRIKWFEKWVTGTNINKVAAAENHYFLPFSRINIKARGDGIACEVFFKGCHPSVMDLKYIFYHYIHFHMKSGVKALQTNRAATF